MLHENDFDKKLREMLRGWEQEPEENDWQVIERRLHHRNNPRFLWWSIAALALILAGTAFWWLRLPEMKGDAIEKQNVAAHVPPVGSSEGNHVSTLPGQDSQTGQGITGQSKAQEAQPHSGEAVVPATNSVRNLSDVRSTVEKNASPATIPGIALGVKSEHATAEKLYTSNEPRNAIVQSRNQAKPENNAGEGEWAAVNNFPTSAARLAAADLPAIDGKRITQNAPAPDFQTVKPIVVLQNNQPMHRRVNPNWSWQVYAAAGIGQDLNDIQLKSMGNDPSGMFADGYFSFLDSNRTAYLVQRRESKPQNYQHFSAGMLVGRRVNNTLAFKTGLGFVFSRWEQHEEYFQNAVAFQNNSMASNRMALYDSKFSMYQLTVPLELEWKAIDRKWGTIRLLPSLQSRLLLRLEEQQKIYFAGRLLNKDELTNLTTEGRRYQPHLRFGASFQPAFAPGWQIAPAVSRPLNSVYQAKQRPKFSEVSIQLRKTLK